MTLLLAAGSLLDAAPSEVVDAAAAAGFDGVGLRLDPGGSDGPHGPLADRSTRAALWARAAERGLRIHDVEVHRIGTDDADHLDALVAAAADLGADHVLVVSDDADTAATTRAVAAAVERSVDVGARPGRDPVGIAVEYMAWTTPATPNAALDLARATGARIVVDVLHHHRVGAGPDELAALIAAGVVAWVQVCDAPRAVPPPGDRDALVTEARHHRTAPGTGELPLAELLAVVPASVPVSVEVQSDELTRRLAPPARAAHLAAAARRALSRRG